MAQCFHRILTGGYSVELSAYPQASYVSVGDKYL